LKAKVIAILLWALVAVPAKSFPEGSSNGAQSADLTGVLAIPSAIPRGPQDLLQDYEAGMVSVAQQFSGKLVAIAGAVQRGELSREQAEEISGEQYQMAQMQFALLSTLREILAQDLARAAAAPQFVPKQTQENEIVVVAVPFSPLQLNPSVIEYLDLSPTQVSAIQVLMSTERRTLEPLMAQLQTTRQQLLIVAEKKSASSEKEVKALATLQARMLTKVILANSRLRTRMYQLLSPEQQRRLDESQKAAELATNN
jgi:hypothetical protein